MNSKLISPYFILIFKILSFIMNFITLFAGSAMVDKKVLIKKKKKTFMFLSFFHFFIFKLLK